MKVETVTDFAGFRARARELLKSQVRPEDVLWGQDSQASLFAGTEPPATVAEPGPASTEARVSAAFVREATIACDHADPRRFDVLYRLLWKLTHGARDALDDPLDEDGARLRAMVREVHQEEHDLHAFVRFRRVLLPDGTEHWRAWYRPAHPVVRRVAPFFARRYPEMPWTLLTPECTAHWNGRELTFGPGAPHAKEPEGDELDALFLTYYESIYNPARTNAALYRQHVPSRIRAQLPEGGIVKRLTQQSTTRVEQLTTPKASASESLLPASRTLPALREAASTCRACPIGEHATQTVFGEGGKNARLMIVGEQPGDEEDREGRPFVGPAGRLFDTLMHEVGLPRDAAYVTNAVKHFKWEPRGKRRLHSKPNHEEVQACRGWLMAEVEAVKPAMILCLGATAAQSFCGHKFRVTRDRGKPSSTPWAPWWMATYHPSALLRAPSPEARTAMQAELLADLTLARKHLEALSRT